MYSLSKRHHTFYVGDRRVHTPRICVVCSRPLTSLVINENTHITKVAHTRIHINKMFIVDICADIRSCYTEFEKKGELEDG
jgi:hypothetical protein